MILQILYEDDQYIAVDKPHGLLVHKTKLAADVYDNVLDRVMSQIGQSVYAVHRIDRKTSGVLLLAKSKSAVSEISKQWQSGQTKKIYWAIVRGWFPEERISLEYALRDERNRLLTAQTEFALIERSEIPLPYGRYATSRYSLISAMPITGRMHQIRRHLAHLRHPIIADRPHGCNKQNRLFKEKWGIDTMMLCARHLEFVHPFTSELVKIQAPLSSEFLQVMDLLDMQTEPNLLCLT